MAAGSTAFVYGTLMADEVVKKLLGRVKPSKPALLHGFSRYRIRGEVFPALVPSTPTSTVQGKVLLELTDKELGILDVYESEEYYRQTVEPVLEDGSKVTADVYIWQDKYRHKLLPDSWDYEAWRAHNLHIWVDQLEPSEKHPNP